jgi:cysteine-rich repeat protein
MCGVMCAAGYIQSGSTCVPAAGESCATAGSVSIADGRTVVLTGSTVGHTSEIRGSCNSVSTSPDVAYAVTPAASGSLSYRLSALFGVAMVVRDGCPGTNELSCDRTNGGLATGQINVTAGSTYYFWVDGTGGEGTYALELSLDATCGNGQIGGGEACDDGNTTNGDGCSSTCALESGSRTDACPTGTTGGIDLAGGPVWFTGDTSGFGNDLRSTCVSMSANDAVYVVTPSVSGTLRATVYTGPVSGASWDAQVYIRSDCATMTDLACANDAGSRGMETATTAVTAGTRYFVIVDGVSGSVGPFRLSLEIARCGDGVLQTGETCDDGGTAAGDGCDPTCATEARCRANESEPNGYDAPDVASARCDESELFAAINPLSDNDFVSINLVAGQVLTARTFVGSPNACAPGADTILEIFRGPLGAMPPNNTCGGSGALMCNDDIYTGDLCSELSFPVPTSGQYVVRAYAYNDGATIANYGIYLRVR